MSQIPLHEEFKVTATELLGTLRKLVRETGVRRIVVRGSDGRTLVDVPLLLGVLGLVLLPFWSALAIVAGTAQGFRVDVERDAEPAAETAPTPAAPPPSASTGAPQPSA